jgi:hypothetical protein
MMTLRDDLAEIQLGGESYTIEMNFIGDTNSNFGRITMSHPEWEFLAVKPFSIKATLIEIVDLLETNRIIHPENPWGDGFEYDDDDFEEEDDE